MFILYSFIIMINTFLKEWVSFDIVNSNCETLAIDHINLDIYDPI